MLAFKCINPEIWKTSKKIQLQCGVIIIKEANNACTRDKNLHANIDHIIFFKRLKKKRFCLYIFFDTSIKENTVKFRLEREIVKL